MDDIDINSIIQNNELKKEQNSWQYILSYMISVHITTALVRWCLLMCVCVWENLNVTNFLFLFNQVKNLEILVTYV
jgi:hypothetical protein